MKSLSPTPCKMQVKLTLSSHIHDTFLHIPSSLYLKIFTQSQPVLRLISSNTFAFWCVRDASIQECVISLNSKFAEKLGLKNDEYYNISIESVKIEQLSKALVSLPNSSDDWNFVMGNFETVQEIVLDQLRLLTKSFSYPIFTNFRKEPIWIKIEEFGGYRSSETLGVISNESELVFIESPDITHKDESVNLNFPTLMAVPCSDFYFSCHSSHKIPNICSYQNETFKIQRNDLVPRNVLLVPDIIIANIFKLNPKENLQLSPCPPSVDARPGGYHFTVDGNRCDIDNIDHANETIVSTSTGIFVKTSNIDHEIVSKIKSASNLKTIPLNEIAELLLNSKHRLMLFHGQAGIGKTRIAQEAMNQLNYSFEYLSRVVYLDLLIDRLNNIESFLINCGDIIIDHVDEYIQMDSEHEDMAVKKYINLCKEISKMLQFHNNSRIVLISRSTKIFSQFFNTFPLFFDHKFTLSAESNWDLKIRSEPLDVVFGLEKAKSHLTKLILNPLQFYNVYKANNMELHSSILISGPSGSGKTFLALKFLEHYNIPHIRIRGPEILNKYVGSSEKAVRDLFSRARNIKPCVLFFDEIDSLVPKRGSNQSGVTDRIVNQFLTELDGTEDRSGVFVIATTSKKDLIDKAIIRPGRIDQLIELSYPDIEEIKQFIQNKVKGNKEKKMIFKFFERNLNLSLSWADILAIDWENHPASSLDLLRNISFQNGKNQNNSLKPQLRQKLSLA